MTGQALLAWLDGRGVAVWVRVERVRGSTPREAGAWMLVGEREASGTIGGGHLEFTAIADARALLRAGRRVAVRTVALGPSLGQCCGGTVELSFRRLDAAERGWIEQLAALEQDRHVGHARLATRLDPMAVPGAVTAAVAAVDAVAERRAGVAHSRLLDGPAGPGEFVSTLHWQPWHVWVFGAGHVGTALVQVLAALPAAVVWVDPREAPFPPVPPAGVRTLQADSPAHAVATVPAGADVLVMTHSHALDFDVCMAMLSRDDLGYCGLIGSATKAVAFARRFAHRGLDASRVARLHCPIGRRDVDPQRVALDKHPGAIALAVANELWQRRRRATLPEQEATWPGP